MSPVFHARTIEVSGVAHLSKDEVVRLAGISSGTNLLWLDTGTVQRRLEQNPWIRMATVRRSFPARVQIDVVEREPLVVVRGKGGPVLIAADGRRLGAARRGDAFPRVVGKDLEAPIRVIAPMPRWLRREVDRVSIAWDGSVRVLLETGVHIEYGSATETAKKAAALAGLLQWSEQAGTKLVAVDVRFPDAPTARMIGTTPSGSSPSH